MASQAGIAIVVFVTGMNGGSRFLRRSFVAMRPLLGDEINRGTEGRLSVALGIAENQHHRHSGAKGM
jgi:hypothetical protein